MNAILDFNVDTSQPKENCSPRFRTGHVLTMKEKRYWSPEKRQLLIEKVVQTEIHLRQEESKIEFF